MNCNKCGAPIKDGASFCFNCGAPVPNQADSSQQSTVNPEPNSNFNSGASQNSSFENTQSNVQPEFQNNSNKKGNSNFAVASLIFGIISIVPCRFEAIFIPILAIVFGVLGKKSQKSSLANAGIILGIIGIIFSLVYIAVSIIVTIKQHDISNFLNRFIIDNNITF